MKLRVWHVSNVPGELFRQNVASIDEAKLVLNTLARHDLYLGDLVVSNAQGLEVLDEDGDWVEWSHPDTGDDIMGIIREEGSFEPVTTVRNQSPAIQSDDCYALCVRISSAERAQYEGTAEALGISLDELTLMGLSTMVKKYGDSAR